MLKVLPFCIYACVPAVVPLLEAPLQVLFQYGCKTCCHILLNFFYEHKTVTFEPSLESWKAARSCMEWSGEYDGWGIVVISFITKNCCTVGVLCQNAWYRLQPPPSLSLCLHCKICRNALNQSVWGASFIVSFAVCSVILTCIKVHLAILELLYAGRLFIVNLPKMCMIVLITWKQHVDNCVMAKVMPLSWTTE